MKASNDAAVRVLLEHERAGLVRPGDAVVVEDLRALELGVVSEMGLTLSEICLEIVDFRGHRKSG